MSQKTITKLPDLWIEQLNGVWQTPWSDSLLVSGLYLQLGNGTPRLAFQTQTADGESSFSSAAITINARIGRDSAFLRCRVYSADPVNNGLETAITSQTVEITDSGEQEFSFRSLNASGSALYFVFDVPQGQAGVNVECTSSTITYTPPPAPPEPDLAVNVTPSTLYTGNNVTLGFINRLGKTLTVDLSIGATPILHDDDVKNDTLVIYCAETWFSTAGVTGDSTSVTVSVSDPDGRTATARFTLKLRKGSKATPVSPKSIQLDGATGIKFSWTVDETNGAQTKAQLRWSPDGATWTYFDPLEGSDTVYPVEKNTFPPGTIYWQVRVWNTFGVEGGWSASTSFTVSYTATAHVVPVDSPTTGLIKTLKDWPFSVMLETDGTPYEPISIASATYYWRAGTEGEFSAVPMTLYYDRAQTVIHSGTFPTGTIQWYAEATDSTGNTTTTELYTLSTQPGALAATPLSPIDSVESGSGEIVFVWSYSSVNGSLQKEAYLQTSTDGSAWTNLPTVYGADERSYRAPANTFTAGTVYWRVRAVDEEDTASDWSASVSFAVFSAPLVAGLIVDSMPFATVSWQTSGQLAYEIEIDGESYGPYFGAEVRSYMLPEPLSAGAHIARVRAQNQYGLWSEWAEANFYTYAAQQTIDLRARADDSVHLSWTGGDATPPRITVQPVTMSATVGSMCFACDAVGSGLTYQWYKKPPNAADWTPAGPASPTWKIYTEPASLDAHNAEYKCVVRSAAGETESRAATYYYSYPGPAPLIWLEPQDTYQKTGTVTLYCGSTGSSYEWFHRVAEGSALDLEACDENSNLWHIPYSDVRTGDLRVKSGKDSNWHFPQGSPTGGGIGISDGTNVWNMPSGAGIQPGVWQSMGVTTPTLSFPAAILRSGEEFFCRCTNEAGITDSAVAVYIYDDPEDPGIPGDYYIYRDGRLFDRCAISKYEDRTALGTHSYQVLSRYNNNNAHHSGIVTATVTVNCLTVGLLSGGPWQKLRLSDRQSREFRFSRSRKVAYTHYAGAKYPEADVGEQEDLIGSFDAAWTHGQEEEANAFEALLGESVVVKSPRGVVIAGVLAGYDRGDPLFYKSYKFEVRQEDSGGPRYA